MCGQMIEIKSQMSLKVESLIKSFLTECTHKIVG